MKIGEGAESLRAEFAQSFAAPHGAATPTLTELLAIRIGGDPYALQLHEVAGLHSDRRVVPVPSAIPDLIGVAALRGLVAPVYELRTLLGYPRGPLPRWLILARGAHPVWLAFDLYESRVRVSEASISTETHEDSLGRRHVCGAVRTSDTLRPIIHLASVLEAITRRALSHRPRSAAP